MKNKTGKIIGFILGTAGFLILFKMLILDRHPREDELAPGIVVIAAIISGLVFAFIGNQVQYYLANKRVL
jgi:hypothetical protein